MYSEEKGKITRPFPSEAMHNVHDCLRDWMAKAGMSVRIDPAGNMIGHYPAMYEDAQIFLIGSHLDTVPNAGKYDGVLGVLLGIAAIEILGGRRLPVAIEVIGFCEEEGIRFRSPYLGSLAICGHITSELLEKCDADGVSLGEALKRFGLDPAKLSQAAYPTQKVLGYLEVHIEQGPVLESHNLPLGVVEGIVGQTRAWLRFEGKAGHAGTSPMHLRHDALQAAAEFVMAVEKRASSVAGLVATVGSITALPGAVNVIPGTAKLSLDIRHLQDAIREQEYAFLLTQAVAIAARRGVSFHVDQCENHKAVPSDPFLTRLVEEAVAEGGYTVERMVSGAGHDAAIMASLTPMTMLFVRSPGGISHHPDEAVLPGDVAAALEVMTAFLRRQGLANMLADSGDSA